MTLISSLLLLAASNFAVLAATEPVSVTVNEEGKSFQGELYFPQGAKGPVPLVVVVHEWWGKNEYPRMRARKVADELGYAALAVDLFGEGKTAEDPKAAQALAGPFYQNPEMSVKRLQAFISQAGASAQDRLDLSRVAAIGYCFGGSQVLNLARGGALPGGATLRVVASFHGGLKSSLAAKAPIQPKILVLHGEADPMVKPEEVTAFKEEMKKSAADLKFVGYPGATHAFTNPKATETGKKFNIPVAYHADADKKSWNELKGFLSKSLK